MKATRTSLAVLAAVAVAGCGRTSSPVAPPDSPARSDAVQTATTADTVSTELRGVHTFGGGN